jgi:hypothetical protein
MTKYKLNATSIFNPTTHEETYTKVSLVHKDGTPVTVDGEELTYNLNITTAAFSDVVELFNQKSPIEVKLTPRSENYLGSVGEVSNYTWAVTSK